MKMIYKTYQQILKASLMLISVLVCQNVQADLSDSRIRNSDNETVMDLMKLDSSMQNQRMTSQDVQAYVPVSMRSGASEAQVMKGIADQSLKTWFNSAAVKNSSVGRAADRVQSNMKLDASTKTGQGLDQVEHKFTMQLLAFQSSAKVEYSGYLSAVVNHNVADKETDVELSEKILKDKSLFLNHTIKPSDRVSTLGLKWNF